MKKLRGFRLTRHKVATIFRWRARPVGKSSCFGLLSNPISALFRYLQRGATGWCLVDSGTGFIQFGEEKPVEVPKGHLAVYVKESSGNTRRVAVPITYFTNPLFGNLLEEAERIYGYNYPGGITIPCDYSEFEKVNMRIASWNHCRHRRQTRCWR